MNTLVQYSIFSIVLFVHLLSRFERREQMANTVATAVAIVVVVTGYLYYRHVTSQDQRIRAVLDGLKSLEQENPVVGSPKVATCFAATVDYFVDSLALLEALELEPPCEAIPHDVVKTEKELLETFAFFFNHSAASA